MLQQLSKINFPHAELVRLKPHATGVLIVFDSWDINKCGLAHFHRSLFKNIQRKNRELLKFYATVLGDTISEEQQKDAEDAGITLIPRRRNDSIDPEQDPVGLHCLFYHKGYYPNLGDLRNIEYVIGYAPLTAAAAIDIRKSLFPEAQLYQINQLNPDSCHLMTHKERSKLERDMVNFARQADAMVSIGPSMYDYFENAYRVVTEKTKPHIEILPDLGDDFSRQNIQLPEKVHHHMMLSYGVTFTGEREALAEYETVAWAVGRTATMMHDMRHPPPKWNIVGVSPNHYDTVQSKIEEKTNCSFLETRITAECSLVDLRDKLLTSHLCIIGQCQRQYGLYGLESIAAGLPTLISENTELGYLINKYFENNAQWCVVRKSEDWFTTIRDALSQTRVTFKNADKLKKAYLESSKVKESHDRFSAMFKKSGPSQDLDVTITIDVQLWFHCFAEIEDAIDALSRQQSPNMSVIATLEAQLSECRYAFERCQRQLKRIADNLARDSSQLRMHIRQNEDLGINEVRGTKSGSLRMSVNFLGTLQLYKFKSGCRNGRLAAVLKPLLISDMMLKEALKVNIPLKLKVSYNTVQFDAIDKYFIYNQWSIASRSYEELSLKDTFNENDTHMQDHYKTATGDIWNTMAKMRRGPHFQRDIDEDVGRTRLSLRQRVFEVERDRLHITGQEFTNALYNIHEGEGWFIGGKEGSTKIMIKSSTDNKESNTFLRREIELMKELYSNENIDALVGCCTKQVKHS
ncbi:uncharacterized protein [Ptychodera flava]|uniref:uncharacterized protein isoform X2 n=1 Tax=Ptychodera flava TaxID=63121 RepID=UPI00396A4722